MKRTQAFALVLLLAASPGPGGATAQTPEPGAGAAPSPSRAGAEPVFTLLPPGSSETRIIDLAEALELADRQGLEGRRASARTRIARGEAREASLAWIPALTASAGRSRTDGQVQGSFGDFQDVDFRTVAPFGRLSVGLNPAETWFGASSASRKAESAESQDQAVRRLVAVRVAELYYDLVREKADVDISRLAVQDATDLVRITDVLLRQGMGRGDDAQRARTELANTEQRLVAAERRLQVASIDLAAALDLDPAVILVPEPGGAGKITLVPPQIDLATIQQKALEARPEIAAARRQLEAQRTDRSADIARLASPTLELFYQEGSTGEVFSDLSELRRYGVTATWTLSASGFRRLRTSAARSEEAALALEQVEQGVRAEVLTAWVDARAAAVSLERAREAREAAEATLRISQVRFRNGTSLAIEVLQDEQALERARLSEMESIVEFNKAQVRLRTQMDPVMPAALGGAGVGSTSNSPWPPAPSAE